MDVKVCGDKVCSHQALVKQQIGSPLSLVYHASFIALHQQPLVLHLLMQLSLEHALQRYYT